MGEVIDIKSKRNLNELGNGLYHYAADGGCLRVFSVSNEFAVDIPNGVGDGSELKVYLNIGSAAGWGHEGEDAFEESHAAAEFLLEFSVRLPGTVALARHDCHYDSQGTFPPGRYFVYVVPDGAWQGEIFIERISEVF